MNLGTWAKVTIVIADVTINLLLWPIKCIKRQSRPANSAGQEVRIKSDASSTQSHYFQVYKRCAVLV